MCRRFGGAELLGGAYFRGEVLYEFEFYTGYRFTFFPFFSKDAQYFALFAPSVPFAEKCYRYSKYIRHYLKKGHHALSYIHLSSGLNALRTWYFSSNFAVDEKMPHEAGYDSFLSGFG